MKPIIVKYFNKTLLSLLIVPVFFLLHAYNESFGLISVNTLAKLSFTYFLITVSIIAISLIVMKDITKAGVFCFYLLYVFFLFGAVHDFLKKLLGQSVLASYSFLLPFLAIVTVLLLFFMRRSKRKPVLIMRYISTLLILFLFLEIVDFIYKSLHRESPLNQLTEQIDLRIPKYCRSEQPDIFFVVLDEYTSSRCLEEEFNYANTEIDSLLNKNHFFVSEFSESNYNATPFSLASTFNLQYLHLEDNSTVPRLFLQAMQAFEHNRLTDFLEKQGYTLKNYGCFNLAGTSIPTKPYFYDLEYNQIDNQTFFSRVQKDIGFNWMLKDFFTGKFKVPAKYLRAKEYHLFRNNYNYRNLLAELSRFDDKPRFVYAHLMLPHEPYYLNADGSQVPDSLILLQKQNLKDAYLNQVKYCNELLKRIIPSASIQYPRSRVVIIEGDHGFRDYNDPSKMEREFDNLNAYYFSDHDYRLLYPSISPVNSFRVILNKYFCQSLPLLNDSSVYLVNNILRNKQ